MKKILLAVMATAMLFGCDPLAGGRKLMAQNKYEDAARWFGQRVKENPNDYMAYHEMGYAYTRLDMMDEAANAYGQAVKIKPDFFPAYLNLGTVNIKRGWIDGAFAALSKAVELKPDSEVAHANFAWVLAMAWRSTEAEYQMKEAIRLSGGKNKYQDLAEVIAQKREQQAKRKEANAKARAELEARAAAGDPKAIAILKAADGGTAEPKAVPGATAAPPKTAAPAPGGTPIDPAAPAAQPAPGPEPAPKSPPI